MTDARARARRTAAHRRTGGYWLALTEGQAVDLASGFVPTAIKARVIGLLDATNDDARRAARPVRKPGTPR